MKKQLAGYWPVLLLALALCAVVFMNIRPYGYNVTAIFHMDAPTAEDVPLPTGFVMLQVPSYDGAQYYQVARNIPKIVDPTKWSALKGTSPGSYAYQRFLLPLAAYVTAFGQEAALPYTFLLINVIALLAVTIVMLRAGIRPLYALTLCLSPAAMVAMHFTLAEPLTMLLIVIVLLHYRTASRFQPLDLLLLSLLALTREVNILFIAYLIGYSLLKKQWRDAMLLLIPAAVFVGWHSVIYLIFDNVPFLISAGAKQLPGSAAMKVLFGLRGYNAFTLSSVALFLGVVLPGVLWTGLQIVRKKSFDVLTLGALAFFGVMLVMPDYIWGSITSIGRVITPVYPLYILALSERNGRIEQILALSVLLIGLAAAVGLGMSVHPFTVVA